MGASFLHFFPRLRRRDVSSGQASAVPGETSRADARPEFVEALQENRAHLHFPAWLRLGEAEDVAGVRFRLRQAPAASYMQTAVVWGTLIRHAMRLTVAR